MYERDAGRSRRFDARTGQNPQDNEQGEYERDRGAVTRQDPSSLERQQTSAEERGQGGWTGYVVPYRYYGPGYRGVGYYSVMYQGPGEGEDEPQQSRWNQEQASGAQQRGGRSTGGFAGRGPKGYRRSDERIREEVSDRLMEDDMIDASEIEVSVKDGEVTLQGTVNDRGAKRRAEDMAEQVMGVRDVMNQIRVQTGTGSDPASDPRSGDSRQGSTGTQRSSSTGSTRSRQQASTRPASESGEEQTTGTNGRRRAATTSR